MELISWGPRSLEDKASIELKRVFLTVYPNEYCDNTPLRFNERNDQIEQVVPNLFPNHLMCAGIETGLQGACEGDSGGPLQFYDDISDRFFQVGIVHGSAAPDCGDPTMPSVHVRLDDPEILNFVQSAISQEHKSTKEEKLTKIRKENKMDKSAVHVENDMEDQSERHLLLRSDGREPYLELFNWKTGDQCTVTNSTNELLRVGAIFFTFDDAPILCCAPRDCSKFSTHSKLGTSISSPPIDISVFAKHVIVPGMGLVVFTKQSNENVTKTLILDSLEGEWKVGPDIVGLKSMYGTCVVQLNDTTTAFLGGEGSNTTRRIVLYDWYTSAISVLENKLHQDLNFGLCDILVDENNEKTVFYIKNGLREDDSFGIWNPSNGSLQTYPVKPLEEIGNNVILGASTVNNRKDLLIYARGYLRGKTIWKFNFTSTTWIKVGEMLDNDFIFDVKPIKNFTCS